MLICWTQIKLNLKFNLFLKLIKTNLALKFKIYLKFLVQNIMNIIWN